MNNHYFSSSYSEARRRFRELASAAGATLSSYPIRIESADANELTVDVAILGRDDAPTVVTSSGVHGVEGFLGSAIQLALLDRLRNVREKSVRPLLCKAPGESVRRKRGRTLFFRSAPRKRAAYDVRHVIIHALNPYGYANLRRFNEDNIDLNRNLLRDDADYEGAPAHYSRLNYFLNPTSPPKRLEPFRAKAMLQVCRFGMQALKQSIAGGQYEFPQGIFFGGSGPSQSAAILSQHSDRWLGAANKIIHIDFHSGLGAFGQYKLLLAEHTGLERAEWYADVFGAGAVEATNVAERTAYTTSGSVGEWLQQHFAYRDYRFLTAEFGTYGPIRVLAAIRAENRAHHYGIPNSAVYRLAKSELLECFCPTRSFWREQVVDSGMKIIQQGINGLR